MTAATLRPASAVPASGGPGPAGFGRLLRSEWTKIWSVRSTSWSLAILVIGGIGLSTLIAGVMDAHWSTLSAADRQAVTIKGAFGPGLTFAQLPLCVLGVLVITSEYTTGMIRSSLLAVPHADDAGELLAFSSVPIAQAMIGSRIPESLSDPATLRAAFGAGLYLAVLGLFSLAVGAMILFVPNDPQPQAAISKTEAQS